MGSELFAKELRKHCNRFPSISSVCRDTGINRQQFGKYLSGKMLPSARSLRKICEVLGVSEEELMSSSASAGGSPRQSLPRFSDTEYIGSTDMLSAFASERLKAISGGSVGTAVGVLPTGLYYCYFPLHQSSTALQRSLVSIQERAGTMYFSRRTYFTMNDGGRHLNFRGKHTGIVLTNGPEVYFVGVNRLPPRQLSFLTLQTMSILDGKYFAGLSLTRNGQKHIATTCALQFLGKSKRWREHLRAIGSISLSDPTLDSLVALIMDPSRNGGMGHIHSWSVDDLLADSRPASKTWGRDIR